MKCFCLLDGKDIALIMSPRQRRETYRFTLNSCFFASPSQRLCELLPSLDIHHLSVVRHTISHLNLLLRNHWTKLNQILQGWSLGEFLSKLCPTTLVVICFWSSSLKPLGKLDPNLVGMFIWWSSRKCIAFFCWSEVHKRNQRSKGVKKGVCFFIFFSDTSGPSGTKLGRDVHLIVLKEGYCVCCCWSEVHDRNKRPKGVKTNLDGIFSLKNSL